MYHKLPLKERIDLMKSYKKANPDMSYRDMVSDYNDSYQKFDGGGKKDVNREPIITNNPNDPRLRAYNDSLNAYQWNKKALDKVLTTGKSPKGSNVDKINYQKNSKENQLNLDYKKYIDWGLNITKKDVDDEMASVDLYNKGTKKLNRAISYYNFPIIGGGDFKLAQYKKPVQPYIYKKPEEKQVIDSIPKPLAPPVQLFEPKPEVVKKDTSNLPKQLIVNSDTTKQWNFNGPNPVMEYYDKSGKLINKEYFKNMNDFAKGKKIQPLTR